MNKYKYSFDLGAFFGSEEKETKLKAAPEVETSILPRPKQKQEAVQEAEPAYDPYGFIPDFAAAYEGAGGVPSVGSDLPLPAGEEQSRYALAVESLLNEMQGSLTPQPDLTAATPVDTPDMAASVESAVSEAMGTSDPAPEVEATEEDTTATTEGGTTGGLMSPTVESLEGPEAVFSASVQNLQNQTETISKGTKGNNILNAQLRLAELGYDIGRGGKSGLKKDKLGKWVSLDNSQFRGVDSDFGPSTEKAVKSFQEDAGLPVTGSIDAATAQAMAEKPAVTFNVPEEFLQGLSTKQKVHFNAAKDAATEAGLKGAEMASFMAQVAHESDSFNTAKEYASGAAYEGRKDLGNTQTGDGKRYKGRGYIQLTGRSNYDKAGKALGLDLVGNPSLAEDPKVAADVSLWFWKTQVRPQVPDFLDTERVTKVVNGGFNGLNDRKSYLEKFTKKWNEG